MSGHFSPWQPFSRRGEHSSDSSRDLPHHIPKQPKDVWLTVKNNATSQTLGEKDKDDKTTVPDKGEKENNKKNKFGSFMGKLLLKSGNGTVNKPVPKVSKERILKQQVLTEEPFAGLFRLRKNRNDPTTSLYRSGGVSKEGIKFSLKLARQSSPDQKDGPHLNNDNSSCVSNNINSSSVSNRINSKSNCDMEDTSKYRYINGRRTRWDVQNVFCHKSDNVSTPSPILSEHHQVSTYDDEDVDIDGDDSSLFSQKDDGSSIVESLQSDDDVLGPWIELGMVQLAKEDNNSIKTSGTFKATEDCQECIDLNSSRNGDPFEEATVCSACKVEWSSMLQSFADKMKSSSVKVTTKSSTKRQPKKTKLNNDATATSKKPVALAKRGRPPSGSNVQSRDSASNRKASGATTKKSNKYTKPIIPPTKSRHSQKTNRKIMACKKDENMTINETPPNKEEHNAIEDSHITTGAFMTRKTTKALADQHGFYPNPHDFAYQQKVEVLNINGLWYKGSLVMMNKGKVKVKYDGWDDQDEWIIMGSRRLRVASVDETEIVQPNYDDASKEEYIDVVHSGDNDNVASWTDEYNDAQIAPLQGQEESLTELVILPSASSNKQKDDYVSCTLDKDPTQIFNSKEVFMTRSMARELIDEYGFRPNSFGYQRNRAVAITFYSKQVGSRKTKQECVGYLREMHQDQVRVWYPELHQSEWLPIGSRRLRVMTAEEEKTILSNKKIDFNVQEIPPAPKRETSAKKAPESTSEANSVPSLGDKSTNISTAELSESNSEVTVNRKSRGRPKKASTTPNEIAQLDIGGKSDKAHGANEESTTVPTSATATNNIPGKDLANVPEATASNDCISVTSTNINQQTTNKAEKQSQKKKDDKKFLTTGAFATRRTMRQLQDENGFIPNPYGYTNNLTVEILNTRSGKTKFWESGRLVAMRTGQIKVHYEGWPDTYDEWFMVGSRRIRVAQTVQDNDATEEGKEGGTDSAASNVLPKDGIASVQNGDFLVAEFNPELTDEAKKNRKHQLVRPQDYHGMGMLISLEELAAKEAKKKERREKNKHQGTRKLGGSTSKSIMSDGMVSENEDSVGEEYSPAEDKSNKKRMQKKKSPATVKKKVNLQSTVNKCGLSCNDHSNKLPSNTEDESANNKQIISLRLAHVNASKNYKFVANVYGYDYMQHVTVLHMDKKMYEARLISMHKNKVKVHYCGWLDKFDEYITLGSKRLQPIENDHEVQCIEPNYRERYEGMLLNQSVSTEESVDSNTSESSTASPAPQLINRFTRKRLTLEDNSNEDEDKENEVEYHKDTAIKDVDVEEIDSWKVYCNQCNVVIKQFRYYCTYCETPSAGHDYQSFELCLRCFDQNFPFWHNHPRSSFAIQAVIDAEIGPRPIKGELVTVWEEDILEESLANNELPEATNEPMPTNENENGGGSSAVQEVTTDNTIKDTVSLDEAIFAHMTLDPQGTTESLSTTDIINTAATPKNNKDMENGAIGASKVFTGNVPIETDQGYKYLKRWRRRKVCAFCNDDDDTSEELGQFIGPFVIATFNKNGAEKKRSFWAHDACARYSPEVFCTPEGKWYNVTLALRRGRGMRCHVCKEKGATIGCFESKCNKSFHLPCSQKPVSYFKSGVIFWCGVHEAYYNKKDTYVNIFHCDGCSKELADESWFTCVPCASSYFSSFDLCTECYEKFPADHAHNEDDFEETSFAILQEMEAQKATEAARAKEEVRVANAKKKKKPLFPRRRKRLADGSLPVSCCYCGTYEAESWRKGYDGGVIMCNPCFELALLVDNDGKPNDEPLVIDNHAVELDQEQQQQNRYVASIEDYSHKPYFTRDTLSATKFSDASTGPRLASYEPQPNQLFSLTFDSTYFDIPGRAPRWATHSGTDYHGTWLPQTVRRAILKYTRKDERVLSNFLGRGTDAIECFLLQRRCCGVDINPAAVSLSQRNCCFEVPPGLTSAEYRPILVQADSRKLSGSLFGDGSFHHILSHPPYKDCVAYSTHLEGDLSRFTSIDDFKIEYTKVVQESWRLLKMDRRLTLGIGDNREHCFYIPVGFHLIRLYIDQGFELEELVIKRQRYCSAFGLGTYLCVQFDFLVFTHEFIATFKKVPKVNADRMLLMPQDDSESGANNKTSTIKVNRSIHGVPSSAILRKSVVMGTVWVFKPTETYAFDKLCVSRMVERFGKDDGNWEHIEMLLSEDSTTCQDLCETMMMEVNDAEEQTTTTDLQESSKKKNKVVGDELLINGNPLLSEYEQERLRRIEENNKTLLKLGLISELSEESDDVIHYETMMNKEQYQGGELVLMITGHQSDLKPSKVNEYRHTIVQLAMEATTKLASKGMFIVGTQDIRDAYTGKLWPMTMLVLEDIERQVGRDIIKLKEMVVTVPEGYSKDRNSETHQEGQQQQEEDEEMIDIETVNHEYVPIVHAIYLVFQKF